jgi:aspartyl-tRNA(Asn)/glutamyl-tRNA(Gln) amidotransferase subunit B
MPVMNVEAIRLTVQSGLMLGCEIGAFSKFDRKSYFYPDMPKNYQITQYDKPLCLGGGLEIEVGGQTKRIRLTRIHLEEDVGKSTHHATCSGVDFNRAGVPLMECVSKPEIHSAQDAVAFLEALKRTLLQLGVSDVKMEEGSLRCDANVSIRLAGSGELGTKAEIKNMNSFRSVGRAIESEIDRQIEVVETGGRVVQETRGWDEARGVTISMRSKEQAHDYRYFPDPDLVPMEVSRERVEALRATLPEAPWIRFTRYTAEMGLSPTQATQLVDNVPLADFFDRCVTASKNPQQATNFILGDLSRLANESGVQVAESKLRAEDVAELVALVEGKIVNSKIAKSLLERMWAGEGSPKAIVEREGLAQTSDPGAVARFVDEVLAANPNVVADFRAGKTNVAGFLVGQIMKASRGKADPELVNRMLREKLAASDE